MCSMIAQYKEESVETNNKCRFKFNPLESAHNWHTLDYFQHLVNEFFLEDIHTHQGTKKILHEMISGCYSEEKPVIFSWVSPIPDDEYYVYVNAHEYVDMFIKMRKALFLIQESLSMNYHEETKAAGNEFYNHVATLKNMLHNQVEVYDRAKFENTFKINPN